MFTESDGAHRRRRVRNLLISSQRMLVQKVDKAPIVEFHQRLRMKLLKPTSDVLQMRTGIRCHARWSRPAMNATSSVGRGRGKPRDRKPGARSRLPRTDVGHT